MKWFIGGMGNIREVMMTEVNSNYGRLYFCIKTDLSDDGEIYATADEITITENGDLIMKRSDGQTMLAFSSGNWKCIFAASAIDGSAVSVEHWKGEKISRYKE